MPTEVTVDDALLRVRFHDGTETTTSLERFPRLLHATPKQRSVWEVIGKGDGIHWPEIDEDISVRTLCGEPPIPATPSSKMKEVLKLTGEIYKASDRLRTLSGRSFTPDGHFVAAVGKVVAEYIYDLQPGCKEETRFVDATTRTNRTVQIMLAGPTGTRFGIQWSEQVRDYHAEILLCVKLTRQGFEEIYNGPYPVELLEGKPAGQVPIGLKRLQELNPALLGKTHSFVSINRFLPPDLADVA